MKEKLIKIYQDTKDICSSIPVPITEKFNWIEDDIQGGNNYPIKSGNIIVEPMDTVSALIKYSKLGKTAVLNMASSKRKGGGVENGARAQEEGLFRCSNLFTIPDGLYPIGREEYIYTQDATFVKDFNYQEMTSIKADVITIPAINLNSKSEDKSGLGDYESEYLDRMFYMINSALINGCDNIILGAWGCGVFGNDPKIISELFKETLLGSEDRHTDWIPSSLCKMFNNVVFAVINDHNSVGSNYEVFKSTFQ